ncbi:hypothetical protein BC828DRAFT_375987 [Blastocladiella britannica]|nr:hypothetical protein BC828DRAFT_375987 [Blastocladiella britannica]
MKITLTIAAVAALAAQASATMSAKYSYLNGVTPITQTCSSQGQVAADFPVEFPSSKSKVSYWVHFGNPDTNTIKVPASLVKLRTTGVGAGKGRKISYVAGSRVARHVLTKVPADIVATHGSSTKSYQAAQHYATAVGAWFTYKHGAVHAPTLKAEITKAAQAKKKASGSKATSSLVSSLSLVRAAAMLAKSGSGAADSAVLKEAAAVLTNFHQAVASTSSVNSKVMSMGAIGPFHAVVDAAKAGDGSGKHWAAAVYDFTSYVLSAPTTKGPATYHSIMVFTPQTNMAPVKALTEHKALVQSSVLVPRRHVYSNNPTCAAIYDPTSSIDIGKVKISSSTLQSKNAPFQFATTIQTYPTGATEKAVASELAGKNTVDITQTFRFKVMPGCNAGGIEPVAFVSAATCYPRESPKKSLEDDEFDLDFAISDSIEEYSGDGDEDMSIDDEEYDE